MATYRHHVSASARPAFRAPLRPLTSDDLAAVECGLRSGITPDLQTVERMAKRIRDLEDAVRMNARRVEVAP